MPGWEGRRQVGAARRQSLVAGGACGPSPAGPTPGDTHPMTWFEQAREADRSGDWDTAIALVRAHAECYSVDPDAHNNHLWHMDLLVRAQRIGELSELARTDVHARRRLNRSLRNRRS